jgi:hypothetical protein
MASSIPAPKPLSFTRNVEENWRKWIQQYKLFMAATEKNRKSEKLQCAMFLNLAGETAIEIYNTFTFTESEIDKIEPLISSRLTVRRIKILRTSHMYSIVENNTWMKHSIIS